jgi:drug/metabolite transporter (DMT)-like permease
LGHSNSISSDRLMMAPFEKTLHNTRSQASVALAAGLLTITLFALTPTTTRLAITQVDGFDIGLIRTVGGGTIALMLIVLLRIHPPPDSAQWKNLGLFSLGSFLLFPMLFSIGTQNTSATDASLIMASMPLVTSSLGFVIDRRVPGAAWLLGSALAMAGEVILLFAIDGKSSVQPTIAGNLIVLASCCSFCVGAVAGSRLAARIGPWQATFWAIGVASIALLPVAAAESRHISILSIAPITWAALLHLSVGASLIACVAWSFALGRGGIARVAPLQFAQPVFALGFAAALLGESIGLGSLSCAAAILIGLIITWRSETMAGNVLGGTLAATGVIRQRDPGRVRSVARLYRDFVERRRARRELLDMHYSQVKDIGFPSEFDESRDRAHWRRD